MTRGVSVILWGALLAPLVTWLPMLAHHAPWTGLPPYDPARGIDFWSAQTIWFTALTLIAAIVAQDDKWLALAVFAAGFAIFWRGIRLDPTHSVLFACGALGLWAVRRAPGRMTSTVMTALAWSGIFQAVYIIQQHVFQYDVLWMIWGGPRVPVVQPLGTLGTVDAATAYVAITAPLMPLWALPIAIYAVWSGHSLGALAALAVGLGARTLLARVSRPVLYAACAASLIPLAYIVYYKVIIGTATVSGRLAVQKFALTGTAHTSPVFGLGLGGWLQSVPTWQMQQNFNPTGELFAQAHSDPIQWLCETGVFGALLLIGWLWTHRAMFHHATLGPSLSALGVSALAFFPFHVVATALAGILLIGLATPACPEPAPAGG